MVGDGVVVGEGSIVGVPLGSGSGVFCSMRGAATAGGTSNRARTTTAPTEQRTRLRYADLLIVPPASYPKLLPPKAPDLSLPSPACERCNPHSVQIGDRFSTMPERRVCGGS